MYLVPRGIIGMRLLLLNHRSRYAWTLHCNQTSLARLLLAQHEVFHGFQLVQHQLRILLDKIDPRSRLVL